MDLRRWAVLAVAVVSCRGGPRVGSFSVRDSSGVQIVSNPATVRGDSGCVAVDSVPMLTIGGADAEGPYNVQNAFGTRRLPDGSVLVLNGATSELRFFGQGGRYLRTVGRFGSGPGEFRRPGAPVWFGTDTLVVYDTWTARATFVSARGVLLKSVRIEGVAGGGELLGRLSDGSLLLAMTAGVTEGTEPGVRRDPVHLVRLSAAGVVRDTLGSFRGPDVAVQIVGSRTAMTGAPFGRHTSFAVAGDRVFVADNAEYRARVYANGRLERIIEKSVEAVPITASDIEREMAQRRGSGRDPSWLAWLDRLYQRDQLPASFPAFGGIAVDAEGWLWVRAYAPSPGGGFAWGIFDASGRLRCTCQLPSGVRVREVGRDYLLGAGSDADGVEHVRLYGLRRSAHGPS